MKNYIIKSVVAIILVLGLLNSLNNQYICSKAWLNFYLDDINRCAEKSFLDVSFQKKNSEFKLNLN